MANVLNIEPRHLVIVQNILKRYTNENIRAWAFGSRVTDTCKTYSDLDLALEDQSNNKIPLSLFASLEDAFDESDLPWRVDIIDLNAVSEEFKKIILSNCTKIEHPQFIETQNGEQMVVLPRKEYEQLCEAAEDTADVQAYDEAKRRLAAGDDELIPSEFADRIIDGENQIRVWREYRGLSVKDLAAKAEISAAYLSQIEGGSRKGSVAIIKALATALSLDLDDLV